MGVVDGATTIHAAGENGIVQWSGVQATAVHAKSGQQEHGWMRQKQHRWIQQACRGSLCMEDARVIG